MKRRSFIAWLSLSLLGCKAAIEKIGVVSAESTPSPSPFPSPVPLLSGSPQSDVAASASPTSAATATATATPSPTPTPEMPVVLDSVHAKVAHLTDALPEATELLEDGSSFRIQAVFGEKLPDSLTVLARTNSEPGELRAHISNEPAADKHQFWTQAKATSKQAPDGTHSIVTITSAQDGRYLVSGKETTSIPDSLAFTVIPSVSQTVTESPSFPDDANVSTQGFRTAQYIDAAPNSRNRSPLPPEKMLKGEKTLLLAMHGAGQQSDGPGQFGWKTFFDWISQSVFADEFKKRFIVVLSQWDTTKPFDVGLDETVTALFSKYGRRNIVILAHSMGGLRARALYAKLFEQGVCAGMVTLGTPHQGSPLACPKLMRHAVSSQPYPTWFLILYQLALSNVLGFIRSLTLGRKLVMQWFDDPKGFKQFSDGLRSLASYDDIPIGEFVTRVSLGPQASVPFPEEIGPEDALVLAASASALYADPSVKSAVQTRNDNGVVRINAIKALQAFEKGKEHIIAYGAYCASSTSARIAHALFQEAQSISGLVRLASDLSRQAKQAMLHWLANQIFPIIKTASGRKLRFSDGLVPLESALALGDGVSIEGFSIDGFPDHDGVAVNSRKSPAIKAMRILRDKTHLDLLIDPGHFPSVAQDLIVLDDEHKAKLPSYSLSVADVSAIMAMLQVDFSGYESKTFDYADSTHYWRISVTLSSSYIVVAGKGGGAAAATLSTYVTNNTETIGGQLFDWSGYNYQGYSTYRVRLRKVGNEWGYTHPYETLSFGDSPPNPYPAP